MSSSLNLTLKEYYLWRRKTETSVPWKRQYLNQEFLSYEQKRINDLVKWRIHFSKAKNNQNLDEVSFYTIPIELSSSWKVAIIEEGDYNYIGLSGLQNSPAVLAVALIPRSLKKQLSDYKLIQVTKSKKSYLMNKRNNLIQPVIIIEEWYPLASDKIYVDVPHEKNHIQKIIKENLVGENNLSLSFQSPLMSSPYVPGSIGGISLSSLSTGGLFTQKLIKTILQMTPPEYRGLKPPEKAYLGGKFDEVDGIKFHFAERPYFDKKYVSGFFDHSTNMLTKEISKRNKFSGEYSIFSTINPPYNNSGSVWNELLKNFTDTEITIPENLEEMPEMGVDLTRMQKAINENLWIQIVSSRQLNPSLGKEELIVFNNTLKRLKDDFDAILSGIHEDEFQRDHIVKSMLYDTSYNVKRLTQSFARAEDRNKLNEFDFEKARNLIVDNFTGFIGHSRFKSIKYSMEMKKRNSRFSIIETEIINNPKSNTKEIFDSVKSTGLFKDIYDLQELLDWTRKNGHVWVDREGKYSWV